ncbi:MAG: dihydrodipicolinate synthase family protein [Caldilineales bacterium]|nr:dihydrodipicolinate synthase family protein [Caldilineales bacterium]
MSSSITLGGILPACITPFDNGRIAPGAMAENIGRWLESGLDGVLVFGSTGEYVYLTDDERRPLLAAARRAVPSDRLFLVGCGAESTATALRYLREAADEGADAALVVTPVYYTRGDTAAQRRHYTHLADHSPIPVLLYSVAPTRPTTCPLTSSSSWPSIPTSSASRTPPAISTGWPCRSGRTSPISPFSRAAQPSSSRR